MTNIWKKFNHLMAIVSGVLLILVMFIIVVDVLGKIFFNSPILGVSDFVIVLMPIFIFLPMGYAEIIDEHIRVEFLLFLFRKRLLHDVTEILTLICGLVFLGILIWQGWEYSIDSIHMGEYYPGVLRIPVYPAKFAITFGIILFWIQLLKRGISLIRNLF